MGTPHRSEGRLIGFRLADVPEWIRYRAADRLVNQEDSLFGRSQVMLAATSPSDRVYYVSMAAYDRVMRRTRRGGGS